MGKTPPEGRRRERGGRRVVPEAMHAAGYQDHARAPRNVGALSHPTHSAEVEESVCGDRIGLDLEVHESVVRAAAYRVRGCSAARAAGSALTVLLPGRAPRADSVTAGEIESLLGGLPPGKRHALDLVLGALAAALARPCAES